MIFKKKKTPQPVVDNQFYINKREVTIIPATFDEMLEVVFLVLPYIKGYRALKIEYKSGATPADLYFDIVFNILEQLRKEDFIRAVSILLHQDKEFVATLSFSDIIKVIPAIIKANRILDLYQVLYTLGAFE